MLVYAVLNLRDDPTLGPPSMASGEPVKNRSCVSGIQKDFKKRDVHTCMNVRSKNKLRVEKFLAIHEPDWKDLWSVYRI